MRINTDQQQLIMLMIELVTQGLQLDSERDKELCAAAFDLLHAIQIERTEDKS